MQGQRFTLRSRHRANANRGRKRDRRRGGGDLPDLYEAKSTSDRVCTHTGNAHKTKSGGWTYICATARKCKNQVPGSQLVEGAPGNIPVCILDHASKPASTAPCRRVPAGAVDEGGSKRRDRYVSKRQGRECKHLFTMAGGKECTFSAHDCIYEGPEGCTKR